MNDRLYVFLLCSILSSNIARALIVAIGPGKFPSPQRTRRNRQKYGSVTHRELRILFDDSVTYTVATKGRSALPSKPTTYSSAWGGN